MSATQNLVELLLDEALDRFDLHEQPSRWRDVPALCLGDREILHEEGPSSVDVRLTKSEVHRLDMERSDDRRLKFRPAASDWVTIQLHEPKDVAFCIELLEIAVEAN